MKKPVNFDKINLDTYDISGVTTRIVSSDVDADMLDNIPFQPVDGSTIVWIYPQHPANANPTAIAFEWDDWSTRCNVQIRFCYAGLGFNPKSVVTDTIPRSYFNKPSNLRYYISVLIEKYWKNFTEK
jgi:hypothetical protein